jgi:hypothetical protein
MALAALGSKDTEKFADDASFLGLQPLEFAFVKP